jgi:hypothetical protein
MWAMSERDMEVDMLRRGYCCEMLFSNHGENQGILSQRRTEVLSKQELLWIVVKNMIVFRRNNAVMDESPSMG